tara:strand:+ start:2468 stop:2602 length:135 start_codon:yes stop_codon:yes gene_type:complete
MPSGRTAFILDEIKSSSDFMPDEKTKMNMNNNNFIKINLLDDVV